jgi:hypothetical protein
MPHRTSFGRRATSGAPRPVAHAPAPANPILTQEQALAVNSASDWSITDPELAAWKQARKSLWHRLPWRQLSWMASLCFGIASLVLPASVNGTINWILYALMAASFIAGIRMRRARKNAKPIP